MIVTKLSTKGQIVIPNEIRSGFDSGTVFAVTRKNDLIVLKKLKNYTEKELKEIAELDKIWSEIDEGKTKSYSKEEFFRAFDSW